MSADNCASRRPYQWGRHFSDEDIAHARDNGGLLSMEIETSHICNLRCIYCYSAAGRAHHNELTLDEILDVIRQGIDLGLRRAILIGGGEPMLYPRIYDIIEFLNKHDIAIDLFTNGTLIDADDAKRLYDNNVEVVVKCNSLDPAVQDMLVDTAGAFDMIQQGIHHLFDAGYPDETHPMGVETIICQQNYDELPTLWRWARDRKITPYFEMITFQGKAQDRHELNVSVEDHHRLFEDLARIDKNEYGIEWQPHPPVAALSCSRHEYSCTVTSTGYVQPCVGVDIKVGNVRHDSLANIIKTSPVIKSLRNIRNEIKGACAECDHLPECYGCRGMAYHLTGDFLAPDPLCWHNPKHINVEKN